METNEDSKQPYYELTVCGDVQASRSVHITLVNVFVDLVVFTRIAGISLTGSGRNFMFILHRKPCHVPKGL